MKRWLCLVLGLCMLLAMTGCAKQGQTGGNGNEVSSPPLLLINEAQKAEIQAFLNDTANNSFISHNYTSPEKISLYDVFYDGGGIGTTGTVDWSEQEKKDVLAAAEWEAFHNPPLKIPRSEVERVLQEKLGLSQKDVESDLGEHLCYVEAYDAYYALHGDTNYSSVTVTRGKIDQDGRYVIEYTRSTLTEHSGVVTLHKTDKGFQFVSNIKK